MNEISTKVSVKVLRQLISSQQAVSSSTALSHACIMFEEDPCPSKPAYIFMTAVFGKNSH